MPSMAFNSGTLKHGMVVPVRVPSEGQVNLFKNYSYSIGPCPFPCNSKSTRYKSNPFVMNGINVIDDFRLAYKQVDYYTMCINNYQRGHLWWCNG